MIQLELHMIQVLFWMMEHLFTRQSKCAVDRQIRSEVLHLSMLSEEPDWLKGNSSIFSECCHPNQSHVYAQTLPFSGSM